MPLERTLSRHLQGKQKVCRRIFSSSNLKFKAIHSAEAQKYFLFLTHRAAPNTQSFHQIRKKNWTTFHLWFAKMDTKSVMCPLKKGNIFRDLVSSKSLRVSDWLLHAVLFKSITKKCMTCSSASTVLSIGKLAGAWCVYSWNL